VNIHHIRPDPLGNFGLIVKLKLTGSRGKLKCLITEHATEAGANHGLRQFINVIASCSQVAIDTQMK
jgi:hypothetical protein